MCRNRLEVCRCYDVIIHWVGPRELRAKRQMTTRTEDCDVKRQRAQSSAGHWRRWIIAQPIHATPADDDVRPVGFAWQPTPAAAARRLLLRVYDKFTVWTVLLCGSIWLAQRTRKRRFRGLDHAVSGHVKTLLKPSAVYRPTMQSYRTG